MSIVVVVVVVVVVFVVVVVVVTEVLNYDLVMKLATRCVANAVKITDTHQGIESGPGTWEYVRLGEGYIDRPTPVPPVLWRL